MDEDQNRKKINIFIRINAVIGTANRVMQIVYYCATDLLDISSGARNIALTFCLLPSLVNLFMILIFLLFHHEEKHTLLYKIKTFFMFMFSMEFLVSTYAHLSLKTEFSYYSDNLVTTMKVINASNIMFVSVPQILIISVCSSVENEMSKVGIASLVISCVFIIWSIAYYFFCIRYDDEIDEYGAEIMN